MEPVPPPSPASPALRIGAWVAQAFIVFVFLGAGWAKSRTPLPELAQQIPWTADVPPAFVRFIGAVDLLGGIGLLLPALTRILPRLSLLAGWGCATVLTLAVLFHAWRAEWLGAGLNVGFLAVAAFLLWARTRRVPILPR